jgi:hypothetical protein
MLRPVEYACFATALRIRIGSVHQAQPKTLETRAFGAGST